MVQVKNIVNHEVTIVSDSIRDKRMKVTWTIKPGCVADIPLCYGLKRYVDEGLLLLVKGGQIESIPGGLVHRKARPLPPLRSLDEPWLV
jgi:hypothetical protein